MTTASSNRTVLVLGAAIAACLVGLIYLSVELRSMRGELAQSLQVSEQLTSEAQALAAVVTDQAQRIDALEKSPAIVSRIPDRPTPADLDRLQPGIYLLETQTTYDPDADETDAYDITHVIVDIRYDDYGTRLHIGVAKSGWVPVGVYFDYDNDGRADTDMALEFVRDIPIIGRRLARAYGPELAQNLYSIFVDEADSASYTSIDDLSQGAEAASNYVWKFLGDYYEAIEAWVLERLRDEQSNERERDADSVTTT